MAKPFVQRIEKPWGWELILTPPESPVVGKILHIKQGTRLSYQYHEKKVETLCLLSGQAKMIFNDQQIEMETQKGYLIQPGDKHRIEGITDCEIMEASTKEEGTTVRLQDDFQRPNETEKLREQPDRGWQH
jgi:mannose-6-phosphate isomerase-like protein (cupin superfamily)